MSEKINSVDLAELEKQIKTRRLAKHIVAGVSKKVGRRISRTNMSLLYRNGADTPLREMLLAEALSLV
mgnify:FL=1